jgi:hypothetical protein
MGDPSVTPYMGVPSQMSVTYDQLMPLGSTSFTVTADPYALVAISKEGVLYGAAVADESGIAEVSLTPIYVPGTADVVVTNQNRQPFIGTVTVASPDGPYVLFKTSIINDQSGNNNGMADFGETISLNVTLENVGNSNATNLTALLTTSDQYVEITDNNTTLDDILSGATVTETNAFTFVVNDSIPDQHKVIFNLSITDGTDVWSSNFPVLLCAPVLFIGQMTIADNIIGNNNGRLDPGEMAEVIIPVFNNGSSDAPNAMAMLASTSEYLILNTSSAELGTIPYGQSVNTVFTVTVNPATPVGAVADFTLYAESSAYSAEKSFNQKIGLVFEDFETGDFTAFDWQYGGNAEWTVTDNNAWSGTFSAVSGDIGNQQASWLLITFYVPADDTISFFRKVSSEDGYDYLSFYIDDILAGQWAGEKDWERFAYAVTTGTHTFKWEYTKDYSESNGSDCGWIDYVVFRSVGGAGEPLSLTAVAYPQQACIGVGAQLLALPSGGTGMYAYLWSPAETLNDPTAYNPFANPAETTIYTVQVTDGQDTLYAEVTLPVLELPESPAISQQGVQLVSSSAIGNQWYIWGQPIAGATEQTYTPLATGEYYATYSNENGCESAPSNTIYYIYIAVEELESDSKLTVFPNPFNDRVNISYSLNKISDVRLVLFNTVGKEISVLISTRNQPAGNYSCTLNASGLVPGIYYCRFETGGQIVTRKLILTQ